MLTFVRLSGLSYRWTLLYYLIWLYDCINEVILFNIQQRKEICSIIQKKTVFFEYTQNLDFRNPTGKLCLL